MENQKAGFWYNESIKYVVDIMQIMSALLRHKRQRGQYYTLGNPFSLNPFQEWAELIRLKQRVVLEPFAGANNIITLLSDAGYDNEFVSFDIHPTHFAVQKRDTIQDFPGGFSVAITNPPWLARNSATRRGLYFPNTVYDDLYKHCLQLMLDNCDFVAALIPASFLQKDDLKNRLSYFIVLHDPMFSDTENPVALALFGSSEESVRIYHNNSFVGNLSELKQFIPTTHGQSAVRFNAPEGEIGFIAFDNIRERSIRFCEGEDLRRYVIKHTTRMITRIECDAGEHDIVALVHDLNNDINEFRDNTQDVFLTPFKGLRKDGMYRRRMEYSLAKKFILQYV
ncbi:MAG: hypothetical protein F4X82_01265 [Candidatus Spechtbacteria bacterium SB0662_bin_43]|uniref:Uncharacterized protein n=1 Tax=Candidatus Spechtbacteria bacterium SB0662_bin_43 TaxID=2604897 RepID=A0A845DBV6_9BACT|nr:hypothetical protein [Candidatus Spechtbacteria bacterium SB0662_bin_43]